MYVQDMVWLLGYVGCEGVNRCDSEWHFGLHVLLWMCMFLWCGSVCSIVRSIRASGYEGSACVE